MKNRIALAVLIAAAAAGAPGLALARDHGSCTLIETRPFETDEHITTTVRGMIDRDKMLRGQAIKVGTSHAVVTLSGSVESQEKADRAAAMVKRMPEVDKVRNLLKVERR